MAVSFLDQNVLVDGVVGKDDDAGERRACLVGLYLSRRAG